MTSSPNGLSQIFGVSRLANILSIYLSLLICGCSALSDTDNAPAVGTIGGMAVGAALGSLDGHAGSGAFIGGMLGRSGGEIAKYENFHARAGENHLVQNLPDTLKAADHFDALLVSEYAMLIRNRTSSPSSGTFSDRPHVKKRLGEIKGWIRQLEVSDKTLTRAIRDASAYRTADMRNLLSHRNRLCARLTSLKEHQSWYQSLGS